MVRITKNLIIFNFIFHNAGENSLIVPSNSVGSYDLIYSPFVVGRSRGSIAFINEVLGEIWYELSMTCEDTAQTRLGVLRCELGKVEFH